MTWGTTAPQTNQSEYESAPNEFFSQNSGSGSVNGERGPDINRMSNEERNAYFAAKRREKELEALRKIGLNPEDFPTSRSTVPKFTASASRSSGGSGQQRDREFSHDRQRNDSFSSPRQPYASEKVSGWGSSSSSNEEVGRTTPISNNNNDLSVSGWGASAQEPPMRAEPVKAPGINSEISWNSAPAVAQQSATDLGASGWNVAQEAPKPVAAPAATQSLGYDQAPKQGNPHDLSVSGWNVEEPPKPAPIAPVAAPAQPKPSNEPSWGLNEAAPKQNNSHDLSVSGWNIEEPPKAAPIAPVAPVAAPPVPAVQASAPPKPSSGPSWNIDEVPKQNNAHELSVSGWNIEEPPKAAPTVVPAAAPVQTKVSNEPSWNIDDAPKQINSHDLSVSGWNIEEPPMAPTPVKTVEAPVAQAAPVKEESQSNWSIDKAPSSGLLPERRPLYSYQNDQLQQQPKPQASVAPIPAPAARQPSSKDPLDRVDSWGCEEPIPAPAPIVAAAPVVEKPSVPIQNDHPIVAHVPIVEAPKVDVVPCQPVRAAAPLVRTPLANVNPLDRLDSWGAFADELPVIAPTVPSVHESIEIKEAPQQPIKVENEAVCPNCNHRFALH